MPVGLSTQPSFCPEWHLLPALSMSSPPQCRIHVRSHVSGLSVLLRLKRLVSAGDMKAGTDGLTAAGTIALPELMLQLIDDEKQTGSGRAEQTARTGMSPLGVIAMTDTGTVTAGIGGMTDIAVGTGTHPGAIVIGHMMATGIVAETGAPQGMIGDTKMTAVGMTETASAHLVKLGHQHTKMTRTPLMWV